MARTRASVAAKVATGKSSKARCSAAPPPSSAVSSGAGSEKSSKSYSGGNPVCPRETPKWQKPITNFFIQNQATGSPEKDDGDYEVQAGSSKSKHKRTIIHSDDEEETTEKPKNSELDESIELEPLNGEDSHKINEYYTKDKGKGKKSNKENINNSVATNKRHFEQLNSSCEEVEPSNKKVKVDCDN